MQPIILSFIPLLAAVISVEGHGQLTFPVPRPDVNGLTISSGQREPTFTLNGPRTASWGGPAGGYFVDSFRCHSFTNRSPQVTTLTAGQPFTFEWAFEANHPGDCFLYISSPGQDMRNPSSWYKIAQFPGCGANDGLAPPLLNRYTITIPDGVPACDPCVLRWEWYAVQQVTNIEFYSQCTDVRVVNPLGTGAVLSGTTADAYRKAYNGQFGPQFLVGPPLATYRLVRNDGTTQTVTVIPASTTAGVVTTTPPASTTTPPAPTTTTPPPPSTTTACNAVTVTVTRTVTDTVSACGTSSPAPTTTQVPTTTTSTSTPTPTPTPTTTTSTSGTPPPPSTGCSFAGAGAVVDQWNGGFVVNNARFNNGAQNTIVEWDWINGPVTITNIWNAVIDTSFTTTARVRVRTQWQGSAFGFQGTGTFGAGNIRVNGLACGVPATSATTSSTTSSPTPTSTPTPTPTGPGLQMVGLNAGGLDFGTGVMPGTINTNYVAPTQAALSYWISQGANVFRLPFAWERLQLTKGGSSLDGPAAQVIDDIITYLTSRGVSVILDPHNNECGVCHMKAAVTKQDLAALWSAVAIKYRSNALVIFGIYNEPMNNYAQFDVNTWLDWAQTSVNAIRATGAGNLILVPGVFWSGAHSWANLNDAMKNLQDSNFAFDMHQYFDNNYSGTQYGCAGASGALAGVQSATQWLAANNKRAFLGEFNAVVDANNNAQCKSAVYTVLDHLKANRNQWLGFAVWVFAPWSIGMNVYDTQPRNNADWFANMRVQWGTA